MTLAAPTPETSEPLLTLRRHRAVQAWTLLGISLASIGCGLALLVLVRGQDGHAAFQRAVGWQFMIWGAIDLMFALTGVVQSARAARRPVTPQTEADEFLAGEKLLRALRFNQKLNIGYLVVAAGLLIGAATAWNPSLAGHGVGVLLQGGFLFVFDRLYEARYAQLMTAPPEA